MRWRQLTKPTADFRLGVLSTADTGAWRDEGTRRADKCTHPVRRWRAVRLSTAWWHFQPEGHGPVIDEADLHIGAKLPLRHVRPLFVGVLAQKGE